MVGTAYLSLVFLTAIVGMAVAFLSWLNRDRPGAKPLAVFVAAASVWALVEGLTVASAGLVAMLRWQQVGLTLWALVPLAWFVTVLVYTGNRHWLTRTRAVLLLVEPAVFVTLVWSNDSHGLVFSGPQRSPFGELSTLVVEFGLAVWAHEVYATLLVAAGAFLLVEQLFRPNRTHRRQATALLVAISVPMVGRASAVFGLFPGGLDPSGAGFVLTGIVFAVAVFRTKLLGIAPFTREIGREAVLSELDDAILILDDGDRIVDVNGAGETLLGAEAAACVGRPLGELRPAVAEAIAETDDRTELELDVQGKLRYYDVRLSELYRGYGTVSGTVVSLRDVTERRQRQQRLDVLNRLLRHNVRNELNVARGKVELTRASITDEQARERLDGAITAIDGLVARSDKVGRVSRLLDGDGRESIDIAAELHGKQEAGGFGPPDGTVHLELPDSLWVTGGSPLVAAVEELVTNAVEHDDGEDPRATITVDDGRSDDTHVVITVSDTGPGIDQQEWQTILDGEETPLQHTSGVGLWLVNWVVARAGGALDFETNGGTTVRVRLPRAEKPA